jgi:HTH-type transcriptional regulator, transcriptional repressor of NAD biosynthesis genes
VQSSERLSSASPRLRGSLIRSHDSLVATEEHDRAYSSPMRALVLGKFLPYHLGHAHLIRTARAQCDALTVLVCSIKAEPIPGVLRFQWVRDAHPDARVLHVAEEVPQAPEDSPDFWPIWTDLIARHAGRIDVVYTSESYGDELARRLHARHVCVDRPRATFPVSGTTIRADPMATWGFIPRQARGYFARRVAIVGPESSGKSTLAERLAAHFGTVHVPEFGRDWCLTRPAEHLELPDFEAIAWAQATLEDRMAHDANRVLVCDTELHTTATWSDMIVGTRPPWLTAAARERPYALFLLLGDDAPWIQDGTRVLGERRAEHLERLRAELREANREVVDLGGSWEDRFTGAVRAIERMMRRPSLPFVSA